MRNTSVLTRVRAAEEHSVLAWTGSGVQLSQLERMPVAVRHDIAVCLRTAGPA